jgi:hypothetical protein
LKAATVTLTVTLPQSALTTGKPGRPIVCPPAAGSGTNCGLDLYRDIDPTHEDDALWALGG